ncbi:hypothetical protein CDA63_12790 [Hymenobacter amundsenii]|uniref:Uncharacterized protein n=1 Tax=Hymenobacter amundsenii TaxID=2006685 RepID=A0A246FJA6_9BACT|nr:hypothetical protein [Hymenobacter amundsenii]OWP62647.1 hypothetical protein CDA63_12790 [Hymenobacter amundsenii]
MPLNIRTTLASTILLGLFGAVFLLVQYKFPVSLKYPHQWGYPRPFVPDSVAQELIRQLIEQADFDGPRSVAQLGGWAPRTGADAAGVKPAGLDFRISWVLLEHQPISAYLKMEDAEVRY